jgi:tetratricopeptide (TPR) repeat protein
MMKCGRNAFFAGAIGDRLLVILSFVLVALVSSGVPPAEAWQVSPGDLIRLEGAVQNSAGEPVSGASVTLQKSDGSRGLEAKTDSRGAFFFSGLTAGVYALKAEQSEWGRGKADSVLLSAGETKRIRVVLVREDAASGTTRDKTSPSQPLQTPMQFADEPSFAVAGITDTNNVGLHASAKDQRTSDALARDTRALEPVAPEAHTTETTGEISLHSNPAETEKKLRAGLAQNPESFDTNHQLGEFYCESKRYAEAIPLLSKAFELDSKSAVNSYELALAYLGIGESDRAREQGRKMAAAANSAEAHRYLGDLNERLNDPLGAVREYESAARLDASEESFFDWGTELLLHRASQAATEIFRNGLRVHPGSSKLLTGLGAALYAAGSYEDAAQRLCEASDLKPADVAPYVFLGKMEKAAPAVSLCGEEKLARFVAQQPRSALANYYYGLILWKQAKESGQDGSLEQAKSYLEKAVQFDPKLDEAYLQLGIVYGDRGDFAQAIAAFQRAIHANPQLAEPHYRLSLAYKRTGEEAKAQQEMQTYKEIEKSDAEAQERQQRELQQFLITLKSQSAAPTVH